MELGLDYLATFILQPMALVVAGVGSSPLFNASMASSRYFLVTPSSLVELSIAPMYFTVRSASSKNT